MKSIFCGIIVALAFGQLALAQLQESVNVELVETDVSALDSNGSPVTDLIAQDFVIKEDGIEQPITYFSRILDEQSQVPLTLAFLLDTSGSMSKGGRMQRIDIARQFAVLLMNELKKADQLRVYAFDNIFRALTPMTSDFNVVQQSLNDVKIDTEGSPGTALLASIDLTIGQLEPYFGRKILVICSDGQNNIPGPAPEELIEKLKKRDITVISFGTETKQEYREVIDGTSTRYETPPEVKNAHSLMKHLAEETGGAAFFSKNLADFPQTLERIRSVIRSQYAISYTPTGQRKSGWRKIEVRCKRKGVSLQYRKGYYVEVSPQG